MAAVGTAARSDDSDGGLCGNLSLKDSGQQQWQLQRNPEEGSEKSTTAPDPRREILIRKPEVVESDRRAGGQKTAERHRNELLERIAFGLEAEKEGGGELPVNADTTPREHRAEIMAPLVDDMRTEKQQGPHNPAGEICAETGSGGARRQ